jgi:hypothetical protein
MNSIPVDGKRLFSRVPFHAQVVLYLHNQAVDVNLLDIALKGALVETASPMAIILQEKCRLVLPLTDGGDAIEMRGQVVHLEGKNVGIECQDIDVLSLTRLRRLLELNTGDADMMDRELSHLFGKR